ncbi:hypothetical protein G5B38_06330 [Pseudohalocynthiibacter aestuariivivens]|nr:hypothetical protein [Pseudohalocynthiibacter aestuariivivens]QIE45175.1 hypothetical protein G5B38_06330 [Pseudohalocynthiibacter aestuariivivens]
MFRTAAIVSLVLLVPASAYATDDKAANCAATAGIVSHAVGERNGGNTQEGATDFLTSDEGGIEEKYDAAVPMLVEWVYTLPEDQLTDEAATAFEKACLAHN